MEGEGKTFADEPKHRTPKTQEQRLQEDIAKREKLQARIERRRAKMQRQTVAEFKRQMRQYKLISAEQIQKIFHYVYKTRPGLLGAGES